ncbi:MAG: DUF2470 domain-containing protein, partial [Methylotenera sp.]|nr:DUF2470 domain-containing protein [Methylotenera sp.]
CQHYHQVEADKVEMIGIDPLGFDVRTSAKQRLRFHFSQAISNAEDARTALVTMAKACRV